MSAQRNTLIHAATLGVAVIAATLVWTRDKAPKALAQGDVVVWSGRAGDVAKIKYESKTKKVSIESKTDAAGRYFVGTVEKEHTARHAGDAGAPPPATRTTVGFVSVGPGEKLAEHLAPLKALRALGKIGDDRASEFGLADADATMTVTIGGADHKLVVGGPTPGGGDRYVRLASSGEVYVLKGESLRQIEAPDTMMIERELHEWKDAEVTRAKIEANGKTREIVRGGKMGKRFWADSATAETNDETLGNWMSKLDRLRPTEYPLTEPEGKEVILRVEYTGSKPLGYIELVKGKVGDKSVFFLRTERTRLHGKVVGTLADQLQQDLGTIVK